MIETEGVLERIVSVSVNVLQDLIHCRLPIRRVISQKVRVVRFGRGMRSARRL